MKKRLQMLTVFLSALLLITLCACSPADKEAGTATEPPSAGEEQPSKPQPSEQPYEPPTMSLVAVGDNLIHNTVFMAAKTGGGYDFKAMYAPVRDLIESADFAFVNQEAPLATDIYAASGYPNFNTPQEAGRDLVATGFNVINEANNHAMDKGYKAVLSTVEFWKGQSGVIMTGMYDSEQDRDAPQIFEKNGIKVGILSYTYGTNGIPLPADRPYLVSLIDKARIRRDIGALQGKCDLIIASMHWGAEYNLGVTDEQKELARFLTEEGVGLIIGHHPHVIEPAEWIEAENGNRAFCVYSLGNFISSQQKRVTMLGGMLKLTIAKNEDGSISIENPGILPIVTHYEKNGKNYAVYPLYEYNDELAGRHAVNAYDKPISMDYLTGTAQEVYGSLAILKR